MTKSKKVICFHLLNTFTGSPLVLKNVMEVMVDNGLEVILYTSNTPGFLDDIEGVKRLDNGYRRKGSSILSLISLLYSQLILIPLKCWRYRKEDVFFYVNAVLPIGGLLTARLLKKPNLVHVHEYWVPPPIFSKVLFRLVVKYAQHIVVVSKSLAKKKFKNKENVTVLYNSVTSEFEINAPAELPNRPEFIVLMLASLRSYKGIHEYIEVARRLANIKFKLVVSDDDESVKSFIEANSPPPNFFIFPLTLEVAPFYNEASMIVNLSRKQEWLETFGLTILEGMHYGLPAIVPDDGGITELVEVGYNGYHIDSANLKEIVNKIKLLHENKALYSEFSANSKKKATEFLKSEFKEGVERLLLANQVIGT